MSVLQNRLYRKDLPGNLGADVTLTNNGTTDFRHGAWYDHLSRAVEGRHGL